MKIFLLAGIVIFGWNFSLNAQTSPILTPKEMQADLAILHSAWTHLHPGLYRYNTLEQMDEYFEKARFYCNQNLETTQFYLLLSQLAEKVKCGHTYLNPLNLDSITASNVLPKTVMPFLFTLAENKKMIITSNLSENRSIVKGDAIISINGYPIPWIIDSLLTVSRSDGNNSLGKKLNNINITADEIDHFTLFDIYFPLFFPSTSQNYVLEIKSFEKDKIETINISAISFEDRINMYEILYGQVPTAEKTWDYKFISPNTAYMKFGTFAFWNSDFEPIRYVDSVFSDLLQHPEIKNLIIDIRNNEGGDNTGDYILSFLIKEKMGCEDPDKRCYKYLSIADSLKPYLDTWDNSFKRDKDAAQYFLNELNLYEYKNENQPCAYIIPQQNIFTGNSYLITDAKNSSAGFEFARNFKSAQIGTIIGETTGGSQQGINGGEFFFLTLPNSKLEIDLPLIYNYHPNKEDKGISPDHFVPTTQKDIYSGRDAQLEYILELISKK